MNKTLWSIIIVLICLSHFNTSVYGQKKEVQEEQEIDSTLHSYYLRCNQKAGLPIVNQMADTLFRMAKEKKDLRMQTIALSIRLEYYYLQGTNKDSIFHYVDIVKDFSRKAQLPKYYYFTWSKRLIYYYVKHHQYNLALYDANNLIKEAEQEEYKEGIAAGYNVLSLVYLYKKQYKQAVENKEKEIEIILKYDLDTYNMSTNYISLANLYCYLNQLDKAHESLEKSKKYFVSPLQEFYYNIRIAYYYILKDDIASSWSYIQKAEELLKTDNRYKHITADYYETLRHYYTKTNEYKKALKAHKAQCEILKLKDEYPPDALKICGDLYCKLGDFPKAVQSYQEYNSYTDSLDLIQEDIATAEFSAILGVERLNTEKSELQQQVHQHDLTSKKRIIIFLSAVLLLGLVFFYREHLLNNRLRASQKQLREKNQELLISQEALQRAKELAENGSRMKTEFIQNMNHEIRTPLNSIVGFSQILSNYFDKNDESKEYAQIIEHNSSILLQLFNDVLDLSHLDGEHEIPAHTDADINSICQESINQMQKDLKPEVTLSFLPEQAEFHTKTNAGRITQVLTNLLQNAAKFTQQGCIALSYRINEEEREIVFTVTDTGIGIPLEKHEDVFERFYKIDTFTLGTGLGLPLSRMIVQKMGGSLVLDPDYTSGCRIVLTLPIND